MSFRRGPPKNSPSWLGGTYVRDHRVFYSGYAAPINLIEYGILFYIYSRHLVAMEFLRSPRVI